jgi:hypothetical protein
MISLKVNDDRKNWDKCNSKMEKREQVQEKEKNNEKDNW